MTKIISFGHRCSSAAFIKYGLNLKTESYPFDWLVCTLSTIRKCIESNFVEFLKLDNYVCKDMETCNITDGKKTHFRYEKMYVNTVYEHMETTSTFHSQLALNHKTIHDDYDYYVRCISRLNEALASTTRKVYIYIHPIMGKNDFKQSTSLLEEFDDFNKFICTKSTNIFGVYFIVVKSDYTTKTVKLHESPTHVVYVVYCHEDMADIGTPFEGPDSTETFNEICLRLRIHIYKIDGSFL